MLDFLGDRVKEAAGKSINQKTVMDARDFVISQYQKYVIEENYNLAARYFRLMHYFLSRQNVWGIT